MFEFVMENIDNLIVIMLCTLALVYMVRKGATAQVSRILFYLTTVAEEEYGSGTGPLKFAAVTTWLYERIPSIVKMVFTPQQIDNLIEDAVKEMKEYLLEQEKKALEKENDIVDV